jgi:hypothetical protein
MQLYSWKTGPHQGNGLQDNRQDYDLAYAFLDKRWPAGIGWIMPATGINLSYFHFVGGYSAADEK